MTDQPQAQTIYDLVGREFFVRLVEHFYTRVENDAILRPLYPEDLTDSRDNLAGFLVQYWGGPSDYSDRRGHPRLRMRHFPFRIGQTERNAWADAMRAAVIATVDEAGMPAELAGVLDQYFDRAATHLINAED